ncbi:MAG: hypothetical protein ACKVVT_11870 [Dehalococcoidia bacterium]
MHRRVLTWSTSPAGIRLIGLGLCFAVLALLAAHTWGFRLEEALVYTRYARNFGNGDGLVFNPGEHRNGTPSYAYALLLGIPAIAGITALPQAATLLTLASVAATCALLIFRVAPERSSWGALLAVCGALLFAGLSLNYHALGSEIAPGLLALTVSLAFWRTRPAVAGAAAGCAIALRPELAGFAMALLVLLAIERRPAAARFAIGLAAAVAPWVIGAVAYYGSPLPDWYAARADQSQSGFFGPDGLFGFSTRTLLSDLYLPWGALAFVAVASLLIAAVHTAAPRLRLRRRFVAQHERDARGLVWAILAGASLFVALPAAWDLQQTAPALVPLAWAVAAGLPAAAALGARLAADLNYHSEPLARVVAFGLVATLTAGTLLDTDGLPTGRDESATTVGRWLHQEGGRDCSVATTEPGYLGWYAPNCRIVDTKGLLTDGVAARLADGDVRGWLLDEPPTFIMINAPYFGHEAGAVRALLSGTYGLLPEPRPTGRLVMGRTPAGNATASLLGADVGSGSANLNENLYPVRGVIRPGLFMHAAGRYTFAVTPREGDTFDVFLGMADGSDRSAGVTFRAVLSAAGREPAVLLREVVLPGNDWRRVTVEIPAEFAGATAELTLTTDTAPGGTTDFGWAVWGELRLGEITD